MVIDHLLLVAIIIFVYLGYEVWLQGMKNKLIACGINCAGHKTIVYGETADL